MLALSAALALTGCSSATSGSASGSKHAAVTSFVAKAAGTCMIHQPDLPTRADSQHGDIAHTLTVLRYYGANGSKPFCDGRTASSTDLAWMRLYVQAGADPTFVSRWLGPQ